METEQFAALDGGPGTTEDAGEIIEPTVSWWHFICRFTKWSDPFGLGAFGAFTGARWQARKCVVCDLIQHRRVEIPKDR